MTNSLLKSDNIQLILEWEMVTSINIQFPPGVSFYTDGNKLTIYRLN